MLFFRFSQEEVPFGKGDKVQFKGEEVTIIKFKSMLGSPRTKIREEEEGLSIEVSVDRPFLIVCFQKKDDKRLHQLLLELFLEGCGNGISNR